jgi:acetyl-CoA acetyltransferase
MQDAYVLGAGQSHYGAFPEESYRSLSETAVRETLAGAEGDESVPPAAVDELVFGTLGVGGRQLGLSAPAVATHVGVEGPATRVENACAAGGFAVRAAVRAVRSGAADLVLAGGVEVMNDLGESLPYWLGVSGETAHERLAGTTFSGVYAQMARAHMAEYGTTREDLSRVAVKNHHNGAHNPHAHLDFECTLEEATGGPTVADPLGLYHCCPTTDGAAAVLVASEAAAADLDRTPGRRCRRRQRRRRAVRPRHVHRGPRLADRRRARLRGEWSRPRGPRPGGGTRLFRDRRTARLRGSRLL